MEIIERSSSDPESQAAADRRLERIEKAIKKLNGLDARRDTLEAAVEAADRAEEIARDLEYEIVSSAPDGEQLADDYEELGGGRCAVMCIATNPHPPHHKKQHVHHNLELNSGRGCPRSACFAARSASDAPGGPALPVRDFRGARAGTTGAAALVLRRGAGRDDDP